MNVISNMPKWAQAPLTKFSQGESLEGLEQAPITEDNFQNVGTNMMAPIMMASQDEVAGADEAMEQPGVVKAEGATTHFVGDPEAENAPFEAGFHQADPESGAEVAVYTDSEGIGGKTMTIIKMGDVLMIEAAEFTADAEGNPVGDHYSGMLPA